MQAYTRADVAFLQYGIEIFRYNNIKVAIIRLVVIHIPSNITSLTDD